MRTNRKRRLTGLLAVSLVLAMGATMFHSAGLPGQAEHQVEGDLARGKTVFASSETATDPSAAAVDGRDDTRWAASDRGAQHWLTVDLGDIYDLSRIRLVWETAYANRYEIQISNDNTYFSTIYTVSDGAAGERLLDNLSGSGRYIRLLVTEPNNPGWGVSLWTFEVYGRLTEHRTDLALNKPVYASSSATADGVHYPKENAVDGNPSTRWSSDFNKSGEWITVDLGAVYDISRVELVWSGSTWANAFKIQISNDNQTFTDALSDGSFDRDGLQIVSVKGTGRYIRVYAVEAAADWGISLFSFSVYGVPSEAQVDYALHQPVYASSSLSIDGQDYPKEYAVDGDPSTRWSSNFNKSGEWITVDLGALIDIRRVELTWSGSTWANRFRLQISNDNTHFTDIVTDGVAAGEGLQTLPVFGTGRYIRLYAEEAAADWGISLYSFSVYGQPAQDQALNKTVYASSSITVDGSSYPKEYAVDGDPSTRWSSNFNAVGEWITVDLGAPTDISRVVLYWSGSAWGEQFRLQVSDDNRNFRDIFTGGASSDGTQELDVSGTGRYVRMYVDKASHSWGVSLWAFEVYGSPADIPGLDTYTLTFNKEAPRDVFLPVDWQGYSLKEVRTASGTVDVADYVLDDSGFIFKKEFLLSLLGDNEKGEIYVDVSRENGKARTMTLTVINAREPDPPAKVDSLPQGSQRVSLSLDGWWACEKTAFDAEEVPSAFTNAIPVPGLWDMADQDLGEWDGSALWYKRTVTLPDVPTHAVLRVNKGGYGKYFYINGQYIGDHQYNHTAAELDITPYLRPGDNEIVIKIGYWGSQPQGTAHNGFDGEKGEYLPGLYDSVSLILNSDTTVTQVQSAPDLESGSLRVTAKVENSGDDPRETPVKVEILDGDGIVRGSGECHLTVPSGESVPVDFGRISIDGFGPRTTWSPENPYLYTLRITTAGDTYETKVGMRTFCFDPETKLPMLNGEVYYLRGTNITIGRFFEDPQRGDKPWNKEWVTQLIQQCKDVNWNCARYCVGFPPEIFYEVADELGFLVMDEYPYWQPDNYGACTCGCTAETLIGEATQWIYERNNHPCVILWDMQNESPSFGDLTGEVIRQLRSLDLQKRPWDNGWGEPVEDTDPLECHPYPFFDSNFRLSNLDQMSNRAWWVKDVSAYSNPQIINEYGWLWLTRNGDPTPLTQNLYDQILPNATAEERQTYYADALATLTEFWRAGRYHAGVLQFCILSYDIPGRYTCDVLGPDLTTPGIPDYMAQKLRDAFHPVGIVIEKYAETYAPGTVQTLPVSILNDLNQTQNLEVELLLYQGDRILSSQKAVYTVEALGKTTQNFILNIPNTKGSYRIVARYEKDGETVESVRKITVGEDLNLDPVYGLEYGRPVESSSQHSDPYKADYATDRNPMTRWASQPESENEWITVDLGRTYDINKVRLVWELAYAKEYKVQVSDDNVNFTTIHDGTSSAAGEQVLENLSGSGRYVRIQVTKAFEPFWGVSLYTFNVWGKEAAPSDSETSDTTDSGQDTESSTPPVPSISSSSSVTLPTSGHDEPIPGTGAGTGDIATALAVMLPAGLLIGVLLWKRKVSE